MFALPFGRFDGVRGLPFAFWLPGRVDGVVRSAALAPTCQRAAAAIGRAALEDTSEAPATRPGSGAGRRVLDGWSEAARCDDPRTKKYPNNYMRPNWSTCAAACAAESSNAGAADGARTAVARASKA